MISKSSYKRFIECSKSLWLHFNKPDLAAEMTDIDNNIIENGKRVGELARKLFPGTVDCSVTKPSGEPIYEKQIEATKNAMRNGADALAEASFSVDGLFCAVDILKKDGDGYSVYTKPTT